MSMTFSISGISEEHGYELPCKGCGVSTRAAMEPAEQRHRECRICCGYGGAADADLPRPVFELNVANGHGCEALRALGLPTRTAGLVPAQDLLVALVLRGGSLKARYRSALQRIATQAAKYGRPVIWS